MASMMPPRDTDALPDVMLAVEIPQLGELDLHSDELEIEELGLDENWLRSPQGIAVLAGNALPDGAEPLAMAYAAVANGGRLLIPQLVARLEIEGVVEVIAATNPTVEGDTTALYLARLLKPLGVRVTQLASGLPVGGDLDYADEITLGRALTGRSEL